MMKQVVKPMERGQITIPQKMRQKAGITADTYLWITMSKDNRIVIEPVKEPAQSKEEINEKDWLKFLSNNPAYGFLNNEPEIYTAKDGKPYEPEA